MNRYLPTLRVATASLIAGLAAAYSYYPHNPIIPIAIAVTGTLATYVLPTGGQSAASPATPKSEATSND